MPITHNKNLNPLLTLLTNCISAISATQIFSTKGECYFLLSNFLKTGLYNSSVDPLLDIILFLTVPPEVFFNQNIYKPLKQAHSDIYSMIFWIFSKIKYFII